MVPCSIFKQLSRWFENNQVDVIYPPNEAHAMGFAVGTYSVTGQPAVIFMQNSGLNNIANAQTSLHALYKIPVLLVVSWRGEKPEAPEHDLMGKNLKAYLKLLGIPFRVLSKTGWKRSLSEMTALTKKTKKPTAVIVRKGFFNEEAEQANDLSGKYPLSRYQAIEIIKKSLKNQAVFISTNGHPSRDSYGVSPTPDFYMMGSMGHAFSVGAGTAWGLGKLSDTHRECAKALSRCGGTSHTGSVRRSADSPGVEPSKLNHTEGVRRHPPGVGEEVDQNQTKVVILDGDGGALMQLGSLALVNLVKQTNLIYVVLDNEAYESTGNQPCLSAKINFAQVARGLGFPQVFSLKKPGDLKRAIKSLKLNQAAFIHVKVNRLKAETPRVSDDYTCPQVARRFRGNFTKKRAK